MKKIILTLIALVIGVGVSNAFIDKYTINRSDLPEEAREMLDEHFPKAKVSMIKVDRHLLKKTDYDVKLTNGTKIEFSNKGKWTSVDCKKREVPTALVPDKIRKYVTKNFDSSKIVSIAKRNAGFDIRLGDGRKLRFNLLYQFKGEISESDEPEPDGAELDESDESA